MSERKRTILLWVLAIAILAAIVLALFATGFFDAISSQEKLEAYIQASTPWSHLVFFGVQLVSVVIAPIPSNITAVVGGVLFGMVPAFLLTWGAVVLGSMIVFALARVLGQKFASQLVGKKLSEKYLDVIRRKQEALPAALPAGPPLGPAGGLRRGRLRPGHPHLGDGAHRRGGHRCLYPGYEIRG